jgi:acyl carrier protein
MEASDIYARLEKVFHDVFDADAITVTADLTADQVEDWDSLAHIRLILAVERAFGIKFPAAQTANLKNVGELAELIRVKTSAK